MSGYGSSGQDSAGSTSAATDTGAQNAEAQPASDTGAKNAEVQPAVDNSGVTEPTELTFIFADGDDGAKQSMNTIVDRFNESHENITVTIEPGNGGQQVYDALKTQIEEHLAQ